ncbi:MAG: GNAT family N-acetyltransferase [Candidatus Sulfotelmatobacter sp.]
MFTYKVIESGVTPAAASEIEDPLTDWLSGSAIELTPVQPADEPFLYRTYASTRVEELALTGWNDEQREGFLRMQYEAQRSSYRTQSPGAEYFVILCDGSPAGRLTVDREPGKIHIVDIAFVPEFRGQGIGTALMRAIQREASQAGKSVDLYVERFNPALRWYERMGFEVVSGGPIYLEMAWRPSEATKSNFQESSVRAAYANRVD